MTSFSSAIQKLEFDRVKQRVIRYAASDAGRELLESMKISSSVETIRDELNAVTELKQILIEEGGIPLDGVQPARTAIQKSGVEGMFLQPRELLQVYSILRVSRLLKSFLVKKGDVYPLTYVLLDRLFIDKILEYNIEQTVDETEAIRANASRELQSIRKAIADRYDALRKRLESILKGVSAQGFSQEEIITTREGRMVIPVKSEHKNQVRGFIHSASSSGATVFIEPSETLELNNEIRSLQFQEQREIERILRALTGRVTTIRAELLANVEILARVDALHAKAKYSIEVLGVAPEIHESGTLKLVGARHPILLMNHGYTETVPLDLELGNAFHTLVISGPNAGGKSVAMKCVGLIALMVQAGLHVPVSDQSRMRVFKKIMADIGDDQSIENDLSTFSSHLRNLQGIALEADESSLVLIDEVGAGTDPSEGGAIAAALLELLTEQRAYTIATTHHGALKAFAHETPGIENGAMEFNQEALTPTYRFKSGVPGSSYALEMASRIGFDDDFLSRSRSYLGTQQTRLDSLITRLEAAAQQYRMDMDALSEEKARVDALVMQYEAKIKAQASELKDTKRKALEEAKRIVDNANAVIERSIKEIREKSAEKTIVKEVRQRVETLRLDVEDEAREIGESRSVPSAVDLAAGSLVTLRSGSENGEIITVAPDRKTAVVAFGNIKMKLAMDELVRAKKRRHSPVPTSPEPSEKPREVIRDLDLRGMTGEEAIPLVDKLIDDAILAGLHRIDIIHGKGTGALRKKVTEFLSSHPRVKSHRIAEWNEGGTGATVVELQDN